MDWEKLIAPTITLVIGGLVTWAATGGRKALRNLGKTELEIACEKLEAALAAHAAALKTPGKDDDARTLSEVLRLKRDVQARRRLKALLDGFGDEGSE